MYVKNITTRKMLELDVELISKLKIIIKSDIKETVKKIADFRIRFRIICCILMS